MKQTNRTLGIVAITLLLTFLIGMLHADAKGLLKVAVIDTGFTPIPYDSTGMKICKTGHYDFSTRSAKVGFDQHFHGSYVTQLINARAQRGDMCFLIYKVFGKGTGYNDVERAFRMAAYNGARIINFSVGMYRHDNSLKKVLKRITNRGIKIFAAAGNSRKNLNKKCNVYPSCYRGINSNLIRVGALDEDMDVAKYSNFGVKVSVYKYGRLRDGSRGTSFAAPRAAGDYIRSLGGK